MRVLNLAFYQFAAIEDPVHYQRVFREFCLGKAFRGSLLFGHEGLNGMVSGEEPALREFQAFLRSFPEFSSMPFKESWSSSIAFPRMLIKVKKEIIPIGDSKVEPARRTGARVSAHQLKAWLDEGKEMLLLDTRNDYEVDYGTFEGATRMDLKNFRDFPKELAKLPEETKKKPLVMFCTGGIRCEKASVVALNQGYEEVYQLDGGILKYFEDCGGAHYEGNCFVFDRRIALNPDLTEILPQETLTANSRELTLPDSSPS